MSRVVGQAGAVSISDRGTFAADANLDPGPSQIPVLQVGAAIACIATLGLATLPSLTSPNHPTLASQLGLQSHPTAGPPISVAPAASASESETGATLTALSPASVTAGEGTARVAVSPDGKNVYATNRYAEPTGTISEYSRNAETGVLTPLATVAAGEEPEGVVVSPDGKNVYVSDRGSNTVSQYSRNTTAGELKALSAATVEAGEGPIGIAISPNGKSVYAANCKSQTVSQYSRSTETGALSVSSSAIAAGANAHGIVVSPDEENVYVTNYGSGTVSQYSRNTETGKLTALSEATVPVGGNPHDLAISPDGKSVYVANNLSEGTVSQFARAETGQLTALSPATVNTGGGYTECVVVSPNGDSVYATNQLQSGSGSVSEYSRNTETGALVALSLTPTIGAGTETEGIAISPEGNSVYATNYESGSISQYARNLGLTRPPSVVTGSASGVGQSSATVSGSVTPNGEATTFGFDYGITTLYGAQAPAPRDPNVRSAASAQPVRATLAGLAANTTYHFRIVATSAGGTSYGGDQTFTTLPNPPAVVTGAASAATQTAARIASLIAGQLTRAGTAAKIAALLKRGGIVIALNAPEAGTAVIGWYEVPPGARLAKKTKAKPILVASGMLIFRAAGTARITIKLTVAGKRLLKHAKQLKLTAEGIFTPIGSPPVSAGRTFVLKQ